MLTQGDDVEVHALAGRGWSISAIARHLGRDHKTVRAYVRGELPVTRRLDSRNTPRISGRHENGPMPPRIDLPQNPDLLVFGRFVRTCRIYLGMSQEEYGRRVGLDQGSMSRLERGVLRAFDYASSFQCSETWA